MSNTSTSYLKIKLVDESNDHEEEINIKLKGAFEEVGFLKRHVCAVCNQEE